MVPNSKLKIRLARPRDVPKVIRMGKDAVKSKTFAKRGLEETFWENRKTCWVAEIDGKLAGAHFVWEDDGKKAWSDILVVSRKYRRNGVGREIHRRTARKLRRLGVRMLVSEVETRNKPSLNWHRRNGYRRLGRVPGWLGKRETAVLFYKKLR